ncbi:restriction endonuclease subunit S [Prosthecomicrobium hirschii]|uniref:restriction endonuclease subunit S n=1 Tax=Prosthecodimorpha hirschii TaxID=665126 RepID=UPI001910A7FA|nr:restriction endonuclease subunit S [Prosthecomicrobium hirschii]
MVTAKDINDGRIVYEQARRTSRNAYLERLTDKSRPNVGDVLVTKDGTLGRIAIVDRADICVNQSVAVLQPNNLIRSAFLKLVLEEPNNHQRMLSEAEGSTIKHIYITRLAKQPVRVPSLAVQDSVLSIVSPLDRKIELNRRMNETLEAMARAIFKDWFVDFGPTRAKQEGRAPYLAPDIWSLFPDRLDDEGKPEGWNIAPLGTCFDVNPSEAIRPGSEAPYLDMAALPTTGPNADEPVDREFRSGSKFRNGDTLVARITPCLENGKTAYIQHLPADSVGWGSTEFIVLRSRPPIPIFVPYLVARLEDFREHAIRSMTGTSGRQRVNASDIQRYFLFSPNKSELWQVFARIGTPMFERIAATQAESRTLAATRDLLLPKLMSGEVRIREAEKAVEDAL